MGTELAVSDKDLERALSESASTKIYHFRLHSFAAGECTLMVPFQKSFERPGGIIAGTVFTTAADVAMWLAIMTRHGKDSHAVTTEMTTAFPNSARKENVQCRAKVLKLGKNLIYGVAECHDNAGKLLTHHTMSYARLET